MSADRDELIARLLAQGGISMFWDNDIDFDRPEEICGECGGDLNKGHIRYGDGRRLCPGDELDP